ncbi:erythromycin esterase family protein [Hymenobacter bucti]|uniref:Erythromycin esterase family protein n=1 Tax=Hymenobacter bucti TaxID=1844114 RepID=A0ABW4QX25_9BACT
MLPHHPLQTPADLDPLLAAIGEARVVLLGEASHGTHEYYTWRTALSKRLIQEKGFHFIAVEGDWPACFEVNTAIKQGQPLAGGSAAGLLGAFSRWPAWMWRNQETAALVEWLHLLNACRMPTDKIGFYGLDVYSLWESLQEVLRYVEQQGDGAVAAAHRAFECFEPYSDDPQAYARAIAFVSKDCEAEVTRLLADLRQRVSQHPRTAGLPLRETDFAAEQNGLVAVNAERYYRALLQGAAAAWNVRDHHMMETLQRLLDLYGPGSKAIVWAHNTHIGDARYTSLCREGEVNLGQLARERLGRENVFAVGFGSHQGSVLAGRHCNDAPRPVAVSEAPAGTWENRLHTDLGGKNGLLLSSELRGQPGLDQPVGHRAIGVVYRPEAEHGNYVPSIIPDRYDAFLHLDQTSQIQLI